MALSTTQSQAAFAAAKKVLPGGVNSPVRAYQSVGRDPIIIAGGQGASVTDVDGNAYIDYVCSYGPLILGHAPARVIDAITRTAAKGTSFGMPTELETQLAQLVIEAVPCAQVVRFVNSGTEATMSAIRLARGATGRAKVIKCIGCYHGHSDGLLVQAGSGAMTLGVPSSPGVPKSITDNTLLVPFNDLSAVRDVISDDVACMIVEPVAGNMGTIQPAEGYLQGLREICDERGVILIFDEVMTGFRVAYGGVQELSGVTPDLTCLGKVIGGGLPCAAYGGREDLMRQMAPDGPVYQAGTLSGNPLAMAAGIATLLALRDSDAYDQLEQSGAALANGLADAAQAAGVAVAISRVGSMITCFFTDQGLPTDYDQACACNTDKFAVFFRAMLDQGMILPPSQFETWFISTVHDASVIEKTIDAAKSAFVKVNGQYD